MSYLYVDHGSLALAADHLRTTLAAIQARLDELAAQLSPLAELWQGSAQASYFIAKTRWDSAMASLNATLSQTQAAVLAANDEYRAADLRAAQAFGG